MITDLTDLNPDIANPLGKSELKKAADKRHFL